MALNSDWQTRRSRLNHTWLKNEFLRYLQELLVRLQQPNPDASRVREFVDQEWRKWQENQSALIDLLKTAEEELSPRQLLNKPPLSSCDEEIRRKLSILVHELWRTRHSTGDRIDTANKAMETALAKAAPLDAHFKDIQHLLLRNPALRTDCVAFEDAVRNLSKAISALPDKILVV